MGTLDQGIGPHTDRQIQLCEALGLDPAEITGVTVELQPMSHTVVRWSGVRRLSPEQFARLLAVFEEAGAPEGPKWQIGPDPWAKPEDPTC